MKRNGKKSKKIRKLILVCTLSAVVLVVSTYTWFIGLQTVNVKPFQINIATTEGLFLSLDGNKWSYELDVVNTAAYANHTNVWAEKGLIPVSSVGDFNVSSSRMDLYEKGSYTTTKGGYRLLASQVNNTGATEGEGYIAFDLFIKNLSGDKYYTELDEKNEEAIYLTTDSVVVESSAGADGQAIKTGIENSVRVGFIQVGRMTADTTEVGSITAMKCNVGEDGKPIIKDGVTSICRDAQIWEPNEKNHVPGALSWYNKSCAQRIGDDVYVAESYKTTEKCTQPVLDATTTDVTDDYLPMQTYAITRTLGVDDHVDVYDGLNMFTTLKKGEGTADDVKVVNDYATYKAATDKSKMTLVNYDYFTDAEKNVVGANRPTFMTLAPNSITKVRVYIWLEGQDIDNYNFAQLGKQITVNFGFTKERYRSEENSTKPPYTYDGPDFVTSDPNYVEYISKEVNS